MDTVLKLHQQNQAMKGLKMAARGAKTGRHIKQSRNVRVYVALLKTRDPYRGSKMQREHGREQQKGDTLGRTD